MNINYIKYSGYLVESGTIKENEVNPIFTEVFKATKQPDEFDAKTLELIQKKCQEHKKKKKS